MSNATAVRQERQPVENVASDIATRRLEADNEFKNRIIRFEGEVRSIPDETELYIHFCNASRELIRFDQSFVGHIKRGTDKFQLKCASSIPSVDRNAPFVRWIEKVISRMLRDTGGVEQLIFRADSYSDATDDETRNYPYQEFIWTPLYSKQKLIGGFIGAREVEWRDQEGALLSRISELYVHALAALKGPDNLVKRKVLNRPVTMSVVLLLCALGFLPVPITALAPVEVTPKEPFILSAPFDGVVKKILPQQGDVVSQGQTVIAFDDVHLLNNKNVAEQRAAVAKARYDRTNQGAISDYSIKRDIEVSKAEFELARTESEYSRELLDKSAVTTPVAGVAIFSDKSDWEGKPVTAGEAILSVANPEKINFSIDLPVKESIVLEQGARVKIFLDSAPLSPIEAVLTEAGYSAAADKRDVLSYSLRAELAESVDALPRLGVQGTAQIFGEQATLAYTIFRRPYAALRQLTGW